LFNYLNTISYDEVLAYLIEIVHEEAVPVNVEIGSRHVDANGDTQVDVLLEYEEPDKECVNEAMARAINAMVIMNQ
jgi:hypothetical protein